MSTPSPGVNIFETIENVSSHPEPYHSRYLVDALKVSLEGDNSLFDAVWRLTAPPAWDTPEHPEISYEKKTEENGQRRIDIYIRDKDNHRVLGIEVKTSESSAQSGQLERYLCDLRANDSEEEVMIAYLTPFNRKRAEEKADSLRTVREFKEFSEKFPDHHGGHVSWLDIADIPWDGNELWKQHQHYIRNKISSPTHLQASTQKDRALDEFFGEKATSRFWETLASMGISPGDNGADINLADFCGNLSSLARCLVSALEELICGGCNVSKSAPKRDKFPEDSRKQFIDSDSRYREVHAALFNLSERFSHVWIEGRNNYGVRVAHKEHPGGVSLITALGRDRFNMGKPK